MKHYSIEWLLTTQIIPKAVPRPFASKYPTRLAYRILTGDGKEIRYNGKPSLAARQRLLSIMRTQTVSRVGVVEYDRLGPFLRLIYNNRLTVRYMYPGDRVLPAGTVHYDRLNAYYPTRYHDPGWGDLPITTVALGKWRFYTTITKDIPFAAIDIFLKGLGVQL